MPAKPVYHVGSRQSALAVKQTEFVIDKLTGLHPHVQWPMQVMATTGDKDQVSALYTMGKGLWTSELEARLVAGELDLVVHSLKDMPTTMPDRCELGAVTEREDPRDVLVCAAAAGQDQHPSLATLPAGSVIGTSSVRRVAQLRRRHPHLEFRDVRGNIITRLRKLDEDGSPYAGLVLAAAGLVRMGLAGRISQYLDWDSDRIMYAVGQGALGVEIRAGDEDVREALRGVDHRDAALACAAERAVMRTLEGGCSVPVGVETRWMEEQPGQLGGGGGDDDDPHRQHDGGEGGTGGGRRLRLRAIVVSLDGAEAVEGEMTEPVDSREEAEALGKKMADSLIERGAGRILDAINAAKRQAITAAAAAAESSQAEAD